MNQDAYEKGTALRRKVMGEKHVAKRGASPDRFTKQQNELVTSIAWGMIWSRPGLPLKVRSLVTLGMLTALNRPDEIRGHIVGALNNGATPEEIIEVFVHAPATAVSPPPTAPCALRGGVQGRGTLEGMRAERMRMRD